jgi:hypothetical protein
MSRAWRIALRAASFVSRPSDLRANAALCAGTLNRRVEPK